MDLSYVVEAYKTFYMQGKGEKFSVLCGRKM
jgi:hypothetical protein